MKKSLYSAMLAMLLILIVGCSISSCIHPKNQRQVWWGDLQRTHSTTEKKTIHIYFDKWGNLYPDKSIFIPYKEFFDTEGKGDTYQINDNSGNLERYFIRNHKAFIQLATRYGTDTNSLGKKNFDSIEKIITSRTDSQINEQLKSSLSGTLVVFVHGFNETNPTGDYKLLREAIQAQGFPHSDDFVFLEVYWDGLTANQADPSKMKIWGRAQKNSSNVSIGLREVLSGIGDDYKIRVISHSLGASVATGALFNTNTKWHDKNEEYRAFATITTTPAQKDIRLGMIAPAIPGVTTFLDFHNRTPAPVSASANTINKIVLAVNTKDYAVTKHAFGRDNAGILGATSLGSDYKNEIYKTKQIFVGSLGYSVAQAATLFVKVDFNNNSVYAKEHGLYYYLLQTGATRLFLENIFN